MLISSTAFPRINSVVLSATAILSLGIGGLYLAAAIPRLRSGFRTLGECSVWLFESADSARAALAAPVSRALRAVVHSPRDAMRLVRTR
jgi:hypothetical protein